MNPCSIACRHFGHSGLRCCSMGTHDKAMGGEQDRHFFRKPTGCSWTTRSHDWKSSCRSTWSVPTCRYIPPGPMCSRRKATPTRHWQPCRRGIAVPRATVMLDDKGVAPFEIAVTWSAWPRRHLFQIAAQSAFINLAVGIARWRFETHRFVRCWYGSRVGQTGTTALNPRPCAPLARRPTLLTER
jgi:hypothetical protein